MLSVALYNNDTFIVVETFIAIDTDTSRRRGGLRRELRRQGRRQVQVFHRCPHFGQSQLYGESKSWLFFVKGP